VCAYRAIQEKLYKRCNNTLSCLSSLLGGGVLITSLTPSLSLAPSPHYPSPRLVHSLVPSFWFFLFEFIDFRHGLCYYYSYFCRRTSPTYCFRSLCTHTFVRIVYYFNVYCLMYLNSLRRREIRTRRNTGNKNKKKYGFIFFSSKTSPNCRRTCVLFGLCYITISTTTTATSPIHKLDYVYRGRDTPFIIIFLNLYTLSLIDVQTKV
jgi:hypothetical protein